MPTLRVGLCIVLVGRMPRFVSSCYASDGNEERRSLFIPALIRRSSTPFVGVWFACFRGRGVYRWSCGNITLLGDACHPATPNNGQGACMAIEDALVLATLLAEYWDKPDGHVEAFYLYEVSHVCICSVIGRSVPRTT